MQQVSIDVLKKRLADWITVYKTGKPEWLYASAVIAIQALKEKIEEKKKSV